MTDSLQILIPLLENTLKTPKDWEELAQFAHDKISPTQVKPDRHNELVNHFIKELLKTNHFKNRFIIK